MAIDRRHVGFRLAPFEVTVDAAHIRRFREAIGDDSPLADPNEAPATFMKVIEGEGNSSRKILTALGIDLRRVLHAEQEFQYVLQIRGGDRISVERVVSEIYDRNDGALEFVVVDSNLRAADGALVGTSRQWILVRNVKPAVV